MQIPIVNRLLHYDPSEIGSYFKTHPDAEKHFHRNLNEANLRQSVIFVYLIMASQVVVAISRWVGDLGFPYYNLSLIVLCSLLLLGYRVSSIRHYATQLWFVLFIVWAATFPFFIVRLGGYESPTYPVYHLVVLYIVVFFWFTFRQYVVLFVCIVLSNAAIGLLQAEVSPESFLYKQILMSVFVGVATAGAYIHTHLRRKEYYQQFVLEEKTSELSHALKEIEDKEIQLIQSEKLASLGRLTAGLAHEVNNPLNFINGNLDLIKEDLLELNSKNKSVTPPNLTNSNSYSDILEQITESLDACKRGSQRIQKIIQDLRMFSRLDEAEWKTVDVRECIGSALSVLEFRLQMLTVVKTYDPNIPPIGCYPAQLGQLFLSLLENAADVIEPPVGQIVITTSFSPNDSVTISISDNGPGIPEAIRGKIFDPFFTTKDVGRGSGVGLAVAHGIAIRHGGNLTFETEVGRGTTFRIRLPLKGVQGENKSGS